MEHELRKAIAAAVEVLNFTVPFISVSQAVEPAVLAGDDSTDVGEEDSFLGQTSDCITQPQTISYFSQAPTNNDPFASIGKQPFTTATPPIGTASFSKPATTLPFTTGAQTGSNVFLPPIPQSQPGYSAPPVSQYTSTTYQTAQQNFPPTSDFITPPPVQPQQGYNPYRHTPQSNKLNPYITPPQLQQTQAPPLQPTSSAPPAQMYQIPPATLPQPPPAQQMPPQPASRPAGPLVPTSSFYTQNLYEPVQPHWFYCVQVECKPVWMPFSVFDSVSLEEVFNSVQPDPESVIVSTDGGRYDVKLYDRLRNSVYWKEESSEVRRCTWFYKGDADSRFIPYTEEFSEKLEAEYKKAVTSNQWHRRLEFPSGEIIVMHNPKVIVQFQPSAVPDEWGTTQDGQTRPRVVKRGIDDDQDDIPDGELPQIDHLIFMVHGIGPVCDLRFRSIVECVDGFRIVSLKLLHTHFKRALEGHKISRVEFLPVHWHGALHGDATGVDRRIKKITLPSTGRLRHFANETLLDIFFYNSPTYCQTIVDQVCMEMNHLYSLFMSRNPNFKGGVSVAGHSLGSLILFDILSNQKDHSSRCPSGMDANGTVKASEANEANQTQSQNQDSLIPSLVGNDEPNELEDEEEEALNIQEALTKLSLSEYSSVFEKEQIDMESLLMCTVDDLKEMGIPLGPRKKIANFVKERASRQEKRKAAVEKKAVMKTHRKATEENSQKAREDPCTTTFEWYKQKDQPKRLSAVGGAVSSMHVNYDHFEVGAGQVSVVYHNLDFEPANMFAMGSPIGVFLTVRGLEKIEDSYRLPTCKGFFNIYHPLDPVAYRIEPMISPELDLKPVLIPHHKGRKRLHLELRDSLSRMGSDLKQGFLSSLKTAWQTLHDFARAHTSSPQLQAELEKVANQIKEEEEKQKQKVEVHKVVESPDSSKDEETSVKIGMLNGGRRIDYVLQEKPIESVNEYLFALQSHLCYWESEDTALMFLKEIYKSVGVSPEQPQH
nr:PREDICTED: SEC23-interacting protein [Latimeria chalumnae]|eukprot:XP_014345834.1 PREDICTED: SEC23-interacting protein [Latimeria chalumnae]